MPLLWGICFFDSIIAKNQYIYTSPQQNLAIK